MALATVGNDSAADKAVLGLCEVLALMFVLPFGDALYHGTPIITARHIAYLVVGFVFAVLGPSWPRIRQRFPESRLVRSARLLASDARAWLAVILVGFLYGIGPELYQRALAPEQPAFIYLSVGGFIGITAILAYIVVCNIILKMKTPFSNFAISITSPPDGGIIEEGKLGWERGNSYLVRWKIKGELPDGHKIWIVNEDSKSGRIWPQDFSSIQLTDDGRWEGRTFLLKDQETVTIVVVLAPPTVHELFEYYHKVRKANDSKVVALDRLPPQCQIVCRRQARQLIKDAR